ncbi:MAG: spore maturation protein [Firmicutes bacterium]|nr:spore maturation protein [Bacillota bacterium]MBR6824604.1 spore maturation protein [Bacillota bacterium]
MSGLSDLLLPLLLLGIPAYGLWRGVPLFAAFAAGAEEGLRLSLRIFPYLLGMLLAVGIFRAGGALDVLLQLLQPLVAWLGLPAEVLPLALLRPLSGSGALGLTAELLQTHGADSFIGRLAAVMQGSTDTTLYVLSVYFGAVGIRDYRYALPLGLTADAMSFLAAFFFCSLFWG